MLATCLGNQSLTHPGLSAFQPLRAVTLPSTQFVLAKCPWKCPNMLSAMLLLGSVTVQPECINFCFDLPASIFTSPEWCRHCSRILKIDRLKIDRTLQACLHLGRLSKTRFPLKSARLTLLSHLQKITLEQWQHRVVHSSLLEGDCHATTTCYHNMQVALFSSFLGGRSLSAFFSSSMRFVAA